MNTIRDILLLTIGLAVSIDGANIMLRAPSTPAVYSMNPDAVGFDRSCLANNPENSAETKQDFIIRAWAGALEMAAAAKNRFAQTRNLFPDDGDEPSGLMIPVVSDQDPAYIWSAITASINYGPGSGQRPAGNQINIICGPVAGLTPAWEDSCKDTPLGAVIAGMRSSQSQNSNALYICDTYFTRDRFDLFKAAAEPGVTPGQNGVTSEVFNKVRQLEGQQGTDAQTLIHEWTHLWWIGPTNVPSGMAQIPDETYGWYECATLAQERSEASNDFLMNADSYAWYAEYGYFKDRLGADHWPSQGPHEKPVQP